LTLLLVYEINLKVCASLILTQIIWHNLELNRGHVGNLFKSSTHSIEPSWGLAFMFLNEH